VSEPAGGWVRRLAGFALAHRGNLVVALGAAVLGSIGQTAVPLIARQIIDNVIISRTARLWPWLGLLIAAAVATFALAYLRRYRGGQVALAVQYDLRNAMHEHLQTMDLQTLDRMSSGQLIARANSDTALAQALLTYLPLLSGNVMMMVLSLGVMVYLSPLLAVVSAIVLPCLFAVSYRMRRRMFPASWDAQQREGELIQIADEDINGVRVVKAFGQEDHEITRVADAASTLYGARMRTVRLQSRYQPLLASVPSFAQVAILALGGWLALHHHISLGTFLAFSTYVGQFANPARQLANVLTVGQRARAGVERIFQLLDLAPAIADAPDAIDLPALRGEISFREVDFAYKAGHPVLQGFNLEIRAGERVALVGTSGSGKSTVAAMISRLHDPDNGTVSIDGIDVRSVSRLSLRRQIGVAFEDSFLFSDTVRGNVAYGRPDATDAEIEAAARAAAAHEFIRELPRGYDTPVGERGLTLSGGQRQRVALARAILVDPAVLVLDDATSAVDARTEQSIHDALRTILEGRTTVLVAHRLSTLHLAERIVVMDAGRVVEQGTHDELNERSTLYRSLLSGLANRDEGAAADADSIDALTALTTAAGGVTAAAWKVDASSDGSDGNGATIKRTGAAVRPGGGAPSLGPGLGGGGQNWRRDLAATPELLAQVAALAPVRDHATVELPHESDQVDGFSLLALLRVFRRPLLLGLLLVVLDALAGLAGPVLVKAGIDDGVRKGSSAALFGAAALLLVVTLADLITQIGETFVTGRTAERVVLSVRVRIWAHLQRQSLDYYEREAAGRIMTRMTTDVDQFESLIENGLVSALVSFVTFVGVGIALLLINLELGLLTLTVVVPLALATVLFRRRATVLYDQSRERIAVVNADFQESLSGIREAQAFAHEAATVEHFHELGRHYLRSRVAAQRLVAMYFPFVQFLSALADVIILGVGARLVGSGDLTTGALIAFILYVDMFFSPIQQLSQVFDSWQQTRVSVNRITELMALRTLTPTAPDAVVPNRLVGDIDMDRVRFSYPAGPARSRRYASGPADPRLLAIDDLPVKPPEALRGIDLRLTAGETVALVGETGAGKSTIVKLLARFYDPDQGHVRIDGLDLRSLDLHGFRTQLGYVPQEAFLFSGTVRDNIAYGRPSATDAEVEAAARAVGAHDFIASQPGGYRASLTERGRSLSSGQRQLLALARAELVDPAVLLLDEATSNLDLATEALVSAAMHQVARARTTVIIAHRLQTARTADRIALLHRGTIVEMGTHDELLAANGGYAAMWHAFELLDSRGTRP
jgi:ATP-binding cassette subfamily B protein